MRHIIQIKIVTILAFFALFFGTSSFALAAGIFFEVKNPEIRAGDEFEVGFFIDTNNEDINAIEGKITFSENFLSVKEIKDGNSIINFWVDKPEVKNGEILFSGITPGGYFGKKGLIFSIIFQAEKESQGFLEVHNAKILLNDGKGTETETIISNLQFTILKQISEFQSIVIGIKDTDKPENFEPVVTKDQMMFDGKYFLVFATQDKGSGLDHYEVCEGNRKCIITESPYLLQNQKLDEKITIKAIDKSGNEKVVILPPQKPLVWYNNYVVIIIVVGLVLMYLICNFLWKKRRK